MSGSPAVKPDEHPFLTAWHVNDLSNAIRGLSVVIQQQTDIQKKLLVAIRDHTAALGGHVSRDTLQNIPAVVLESPTDAPPDNG